MYWGRGAAGGNPPAPSDRPRRWGRLLGAAVLAVPLCALCGCSTGDDRGPSALPAAPSGGSLTQKPGPVLSPSGSPADNEAAPPDPCGLLSVHQVENALHLAVARGTLDQAANACRYTDAAGAEVLTVTAGRLPRAATGGPAQVVELLSAGSTRSTAVVGVTDTAVYYEGRRNTRGVAMARGFQKTVIGVDISTTRQATEEQLRVLARQAAGMV